MNPLQWLARRRLAAQRLSPAEKLNLRLRAQFSDQWPSWNYRIERRILGTALPAVWLWPANKSKHGEGPR